MGRQAQPENCVTAAGQVLTQAAHLLRSAGQPMQQQASNAGIAEEEKRFPAGENGPHPTTRNSRGVLVKLLPPWAVTTRLSSTRTPPRPAR